MLLTDTDFNENIEKETLYPEGYKHNTPKMFQIVPFTKSHLSWKFHQFFRNVASRQTNKRTEVKNNLRRSGETKKYLLIYP